MKITLKIALIIFILISHLDANAELSYTKDYSEIQKYLPSYKKKDLDGLIFRRHGKSANSFMHALGFHQTIKKGKAYLLTKEGIKASKELDGAKSVPDDFLVKIVKPRTTIVIGQWLKNGASTSKIKIQEKISNILGGYGRLLINIDAKKISLPLEIATSEKLGYYGAVAIPMGEKVTFPSEKRNYPIWAMSLGKDYVKDYIMTAKAGGWYLEWHKDRPHFHMPLSKDARGFYILGRSLSNNTFELTAFRIPYGTAVYTKRGAIHCDAGLTGNRWAVGYTTSNNFSTVLLRNRKKEYIEIIAHN